jgi:hypothetical protein
MAARAYDAAAILLLPAGAPINVSGRGGLLGGRLAGGLKTCTLISRQAATHQQQRHRQHTQPPNPTNPTNPSNQPPKQYRVADYDLTALRAMARDDALLELKAHGPPLVAALRQRLDQSPPPPPPQEQEERPARRPQERQGTQQLQEGQQAGQQQQPAEGDGSSGGGGDADTEAAASESAGDAARSGSGEGVGAAEAAKD